MYQNYIIYNATSNSIPPCNRNLPDVSVNLPDGRREDCARSAHVRDYSKLSNLGFYIGRKSTSWR